MRNLHSRARSAFTLIELLVVIAIIGILAALLIVAVTAIFSKGPELQATNDIRQLTIAINNFKAKHGVFPPSHITLAGDQQTLLRVDPASLAYLQIIWPRLFSDPTVRIDWANNSQPQRIYRLDGDQCLVFFLGGIPDATNPDRKGCHGFSSNPVNPADRSDLTKGTRESWYQFDNSRLFIRHRADEVPFYSYADPYYPYPRPSGALQDLPPQPYAYFSSNKHKDGYNQTSSDCPTLLPNGAYFDKYSVNPRRYFNSTTFQIITAGRNGLWGPGGPWLAAEATAIGPDGADDQSNFYDALLGVPQ
jgi:prepilin-type N-terminal cleavage/methylation domain-containing protein